VTLLTPHETFDHVFSKVVLVPIISNVYRDLTAQGIDAMPDLLTLDVPTFLASTARPAYTLGKTNRLMVILAFNNANVTHSPLITSE
jgi:hypothetical protein